MIIFKGKDGDVYFRSTQKTKIAKMISQMLLDDLEYYEISFEEAHQLRMMAAGGKWRNILKKIAILEKGNFNELEEIVSGNV